MKLLLFLFIILFLALFFFGHVTINKKETTGFLRLKISIVASIILSLLIGLPILGILSLF